MGFGVQVTQFPETAFVEGKLTQEQYLDYYCFPTKNPVVEHHEGWVWTYNSKKRKPWDRKTQDYRNNLRYKEWRISVFERDRYTCRKCGQTGGKLEAHHIKKFHQYPDLRFDLDNGLTLCRTCHLQEHRRAK